jgi:hypothetical protein
MLMRVLAFPSLSGRKIIKELFSRNNLQTWCEESKAGPACIDIELPCKAALCEICRLEVINLEQARA